MPNNRRDYASREALLQRVCGEFSEMPCLRLTMPQAQRLFGMPADRCRRVLDGLVRDGTLTRDQDRFRLNDSRIWPEHHPGLALSPHTAQDHPVLVS
jgi:hypothetical protein